MGEKLARAASELWPLRTMAWGLLLVIVDLRVDHVDLVPDPIGWVIALVAGQRLVARHVAFWAVLAACAVGLLCSLPAWVGVTGVLVTAPVVVAETVVVFATCSAVMALLPGRRGTANALRWWDLGLLLGGWLVVAVARQDSDFDALVIVLAIAQLVVLVWFVVLLFGASREHPDPRAKTLQQIP
jgi:hypothetical protein